MHRRELLGVFSVLLIPLPALAADTPLQLELVLISMKSYFQLEIYATSEIETRLPGWVDINASYLIDGAEVALTVIGPSPMSRVGPAPVMLFARQRTLAYRRDIYFPKETNPSVSGSIRVKVTTQSSPPVTAEKSFSLKELTS
jgi:hypothetical protein